MTRSVFSPEYQWLCEKLAAQRRAAGLTQVQVAERLGRPQSFVTKYERGERRLDVIELVEVAAAIGADPVDLVGELARRRGAAEG
ncbi:MAG TPA: helix-turn-helix transcriptional regulator [Patescibacteria group bacterium]|nr:helix-turn-helix transcriptional regulator [Patescibacteria group bacterium]